MNTTDSGRHRRILLYAAITIRFYMSLTSLGIAVAIPSAVRSFDAMASYALIIAVYYAVNLIAASLGGSLSDAIGRQKAISLTLISLSVGCIVCAIAPNIQVFVIGYLLSGLSYGLLMSMPIALVCDNTDLTIRHRYMGFYMGFSNLGMLLGPFIGGFITDRAGFRFAPVYTIPLAIALVVVMLMTPERPRSGRPAQKLDLPGLLFLILGIGPPVVALTLAGSRLSWRSPVTLGMIGLGLIFIAIFIKQEFRSQHPILAVKLFKVRSFVVGNLMIGIVIPYMVLCNSYAIMLVQNGLHKSATISGTINFPKTVMVLTVSWFSSRLMASYRHRLKTMILVAGAIILVTEIAQSQLVQTPAALVFLLLCMAFIGIGECLYTMTLNPYLQSEMTADNLATGVSTASFFQMIGVTLASTGFGIILNVWQGDILAAFPAMSLMAAGGAALYLIVGAVFIKMPKSNY